MFFSGHGCPHPFSFFLRPFICIVNLCAHNEDPAFIACMSPLWQAGYSLVWSQFTYLPGRNWNDRFTTAIFSAHKYVLIGSTDCTALVQCHSSMWSGPTSLMQIRLHLCFKTQQWNWELSHQSRRFCVGGENRTQVSSLWSCNATTELNPPTSCPRNGHPPRAMRCLYKAKQRIFS